MILGGEGKNQDFTPAGRGLSRQGAPRGAHRPRRRARSSASLARCARSSARATPAGGGARRRRRGRAPATRCCCPRPAPASTCSRDYAHRGAVFAQAVRGARRMSASASLMGFARSSAQARRGAPGSGHPRAEPAAIVLLGLVMVTSASVSDRRPGERPAVLLPERQLLLTADRRRLRARWCSRFPPSCSSAPACRCWPSRSRSCVIVLVPGLGHSVNGSRRSAAPRAASTSRSRSSRACWCSSTSPATPCAAKRIARVLPSGSAKPLLTAVRRERAAARWSRTSGPPRCCSPPGSACCSSPARACAT